MQRKPKKKPFGGFSIDPSLGGLLNGIDLNNLDFSQVAQLGSQIGGDPFNQAMAFDDPSMYTDSIVGMGSGQYAAANNPLRTPDEIEEEAKKRTFLGIGKGHARRKLRRENEARQRDNMTTTGQNTNSALEQFKDLSGLFDLIGNFQKGGKLQNGGKYTVTDSNANTMDQRKPNYGHNPLSSLAYQILPESEIGTTMWYYPNIDSDMAAAMGKDRITPWNILKNLPSLARTRQHTLEEIEKGRHPDGTRLTNDLYGKYLGVDVPGQSLKKYKGELPDDLKGTKKEIVSLPKGYERDLLTTARSIYEYENSPNAHDPEKWSTRKRKGDFVHIPIEGKADEALGNISLWYNPKTDEVRYYDQYDLDQIPLADDVVGKPFIVYGRVKSEDVKQDNLSLPEQKALGGKSQLGYSDNSPYKNEPSITIDSNNITMDSTSKTLLAIPDIGHPKILKPKSGTHVFPDASKVLEIPIMAKGGKKKKKIPYYQEGGQPVPQGVQLEEDEVILTPNMDILDTAARKPHQKMDSKTVTDIMRPEDYVLSNRLKIKKSEAEKMSLGFGAMLYREGQIPKMPEEQTIASIFKDGEKELTLAEYGKRVRKKLPITDKDDPFSLKTNDANRAARLPYLAAAVYKNEMKRTKGKPEYQFESAFENPFETSFGSKSGATDEGMSVMGGIGSVPQQKQAGGPLDALGAVAGIGNFFTGMLDTAFYAPKRAKMAQAAIEADRKAIGTLAETQSGFSNAATAAALAGYSLQDPTVNAPQYDSTQLDARVRRVPRTLFDYASGRAMAGSRSFQDSLFKNAGSFGQAANAYAPVHGQNLGLLANFGMQEVQQNIGLENQYRDQKQAFNNNQIVADTTAKNATRANRNNLLAGTASTVSGGISSQGQIETNRQNALRQNALQKSQSQINANSLIQQGTQQAFNNLYMGAASLPSDMFQVQSITPTPPPTNFNPYTINPPVQIQSPTYNPIQPLPPVNNPYLPTNQQGSAVPLGPNSVYNPSTGLWYG